MQMKARLESIRRLGDGAGEDVTPQFVFDMLECFVASNDVESATTLVKHVREEGLVELQPAHYNLMLRLFAHARDKASCEQLLEALRARSRMSNESFACTITLLHHMGVRRRLPSMLKVVDMMARRNVDLAAQPERVLTEDDDADAPDPERVPYESPVLSALLHAVCMGTEGPLAAALVMFWIRAAGAEVSVWDFNNFLTCLHRDTEQFPHVAFVTANVPACDRGWVSLSALEQNVAEWARGQAINAKSVQAVLEGIKGWYAATGTDPATAVYVGWMNTTVRTLEQYHAAILEEVHRRRSVGAHRESAMPIHHHTVLVNAVLGNKTTAVLELREFDQRLAAWGRKDFALAPSSPLDGNTRSSARERRQLRPAEIPESLGFSAFEPDQKFIKDAATFFGEVPRTTRLSVSASYNGLFERIRPSLATGEQAICWAVSQPLIGTNDEARQAIAYVTKAAGNYRTMFKSVKQMVRSLITTVSLNPPRGCKMPSADVAERRRWGMYCEARDIALTLHGQNDAARSAMKQLYLNDCKQQHLRRPEAIATDVEAVRDLFSSVGGIPEAAGGRSTRPIFADVGVVPRHLFDPSVDNPFPHCRLLIAPGEPQLDDHFPAVLELLSKLGDPWWLGEPDAFTDLLRCYLHRLDWDGAVKLAEKAMTQQKFTASLDGVVVSIFDEIGDPCGALPFKAATKLVDLRIVKSRDRTSM